MRAGWSRNPDFTHWAAPAALPVSGRPPSLGRRKGVTMVPLLLWILGVPGLIIILLLLLGVISI
jgi:hypothetical protein